MQQLLSQIGNVQQTQSGGEQSDKVKEQQPGAQSRIDSLEKQVADLNERRLEHLETLQQQQLQMQVNSCFSPLFCLKERKGKNELIPMSNMLMQYDLFVTQILIGSSVIISEGEENMPFLISISQKNY